MIGGAAKKYRSCPRCSSHWRGCRRAAARRAWWNEIEVAFHVGCSTIEKEKGFPESGCLESINGIKDCQTCQNFEDVIHGSPSVAKGVADKRRRGLNLARSHDKSSVAQGCFAPLHSPLSDGNTACLKVLLWFHQGFEHDHELDHYTTITKLFCLMPEGEPAFT